MFASGSNTEQKEFFRPEASNTLTLHSAKKALASMVPTTPS